MAQTPPAEVQPVPSALSGASPRGSNQSGMRAYNERLVLSLVRRHGQLSKADLARLTGLSAQTVSVIMRALEQDDLLLRGKPQRGRVGQPSVPMSLNPDGVFSLGLKIGRRSAEFVLADFVGTIRHRVVTHYMLPRPAEILSFVADCLAGIDERLKPDLEARISGLGIAIPFELWNWADELGAPLEDIDVWRDTDLRSEIASLVPFPVYLQNDATAACGAELVFGRGAALSDYVYFFVGSFAGGGIVLNGSLFTGRTGNAGALGSMPVPGRNKHTEQLIDQASVMVLEGMLRRSGKKLPPDWHEAEDWSGLQPVLGEWLQLAARGLAHATAAACSLIDFSGVIIDGGFPPAVRAALVDATRREMGKLDLQGIAAPQIVEGAVGRIARALGGATLPLFDRYLIDQNALLKEAS